MSKAKVKLDLKGKPIPVKVQFAKQLVVQMDGNPLFPNTNPELTAIVAATIALETSYNDAENAWNVAKAKTSVQNDKENALDLELTNLGNYVEITAKGDPTVIKGAGMEVRGENG